jgi:cell division protein FtsB
MWPAFVIALLLGLLIGYWIGKMFSAGKSALVAAESQIETLQDDLTQAKDTQKLLEQSVADLKYQLGEERKARNYAESRSAKQ